MEKRKPQIFVASSSEGLEIAYAVQESLEHDAECTVWNQGIFDPSSYVLPDLIKTLQVMDYGIFVFSMDDAAIIREQEERIVRDNVVLELGLFLGLLGQNNCFIILPKSKGSIHLPTDLKGLTLLNYNAERNDGNILAALGPVINKIRKKIKSIDIYKKSLSVEIVEQINKMGFSAFYATRDDYAKYRIDASSIDKYIARAKESIIMVSISLTTGLAFDDICKVIAQKLKSKEDFKVTISLLNPFMDELYVTIAPLFELEASALQRRTKDSLKALYDFKSKLRKDEKDRFILKVHNTVPFGSAILLDDNLESGTIQIETKPYNVGMRKSFAFEITNNNEEFYKTIKTSYHSLIRDGILYSDTEL